MKDIIKIEYDKHKSLIFLYLGFIVFLGFFTGPLLGGFPLAAEATQGGGDVPVGDTILSLAVLFSSASFKTIAGSYAGIVGISCEPFTALLFLGIMENINNLIGNPLHVMSTPAGNPVVLVVILVFFIASKLMKCFEGTEVFGIITLGQLEKYLGLAFVIVIGIMNIWGLTDINLNGAVNAASGDVSAVNPLMATITTIYAVFMAIVSIVVYLVIKTVIEGMEVLQMVFSFIPGSAFICEFLKSALVIIILLINVIFPPLGYALNLIIFIIALFLFRKCYVACYYFKEIYAKPLFERFKGFDPHVELTIKLPRKIRKQFVGDKKVELSVPVFIHKYSTLFGMPKKKLVRLYLIGMEDNIYLVSKLWGKKMITYNLKDYDDNPIYIRKGHRFFEVFSYQNVPGNMDKKNPRKEFSFVLSNRYYYALERLIKLTGFTDYQIFLDERKAEKDRIKSEKSAERKEKFDNFKSGVKAFFALDDEKVVDYMIEADSNEETNEE